VGQLAEGHAEELVPAAKMPGLPVATVFFDELQKIVVGNELEYLGKDIFSSVHKIVLYFHKTIFSNRLNLKIGLMPYLQCISKNL